MSRIPEQWSDRCRVFARIVTALAVLAWPALASAASVTASKECLGTCTVVEAQFTIYFTQVISWSATYNGTPTQGHSFYLSTVASNMADIPLTTSGQLSGTRSLTAGTYHISIRVALMGPGFYTVTYNPSTTGEPHLSTIDGTRYDFQSAGEFVLLRHRTGSEVQVRQGPIATSFNPGPAPNAGLPMCVAINTAVAARVGERRVSYQPGGPGPDPANLQLRVDGMVTPLGPIDLGSGGRITPTGPPGGLKIQFPDRGAVYVTPGWWAEQGKWYMNVDLAPRSEGTGLVGRVPEGSWLPTRPDGTSMGPMPQPIHDRYVALYQTFADAWRVTSATSLFDYAPGTTTDTFTDRNWPPERPPCAIPGAVVAQPATEAAAQLACQAVRGVEHDHCVFDVRVTGHPGFATTYAAGQALPIDSGGSTAGTRFALFAGGGLAVPHGTFGAAFDPGPTVSVGVEYLMTSLFSVQGTFGYSRFSSAGSDLGVSQLSAGAKAYLAPAPSAVRPFVTGGAGIYRLSPGSTEFGANTGVGVLFAVTSRFGVQASYDFHAVNTSGTALKFSALQAAVRIRF